MYLIVNESRKKGIQHELYDDKQTAINRARAIANALSNDSFYYAERDYDDFEFYAVYSCEEESVYVEKIELGKETIKIN